MFGSINGKTDLEKLKNSASRQFLGLRNKISALHETGKVVLISSLCINFDYVILISSTKYILSI